MYIYIYIYLILCIWLVQYIEYTNNGKDFQYCLLIHSFIH